MWPGDKVGEPRLRTPSACREQTQALVDALDAHDTAITDAAAESLILRNEPTTADRIWEALMRAA